MKLPWHGYDEIIDVRSPAEYADDHVPSACNLPALSDEERAAIGLLHRQSPFAARREGAGLVAANIARHLREHLAERPPHWRPLIYCWRGGQRSGAVTEVLRRVGWDAQQLRGGYKHYRRLVIDGIADYATQMRWFVIAGKTGAGKTLLLQHLAKCDAQILDLESLCNHRGSVFGGIANSNAELSQPSQKKFESLLFARLWSASSQQPIFVESESRKIGALHIPPPILSAMRQSPIIYIDTPLEARAQHIANEYKDMHDSKTFMTALGSIANFVSKPRVQQWQHLHANQQWQQLASALLEEFYDIGYQKSLAANYPNRTATFAANPNCPQTMQEVAEQLIAFANKVNR